MNIDTVIASLEDLLVLNDRPEILRVKPVDLGLVGNSGWLESCIEDLNCELSLSTVAERLGGLFVVNYVSLRSVDVIVVTKVMCNEQLEPQFSKTE